MPDNKKPWERFTTGQILRILADAVIVNITYAAAFILRFVLLMLFEPETATSELVRTYVTFYTATVPLLHVITLLAFYFNGFYTYGRGYQSRYKALIIIRAVGLSYLIFGFIVLLLPDFIPNPPRSVPIVAGVLAGIALLAARLWSSLWRRAVTVENKLFGEPKMAPVIREVLIIGGAGYIGSNLARRLLENGYRVRVLDALFYGDDSIKDLYDNPDFSFYKGDSRDIYAVVQAMKNADAVVHLGEIVGDPACAIDEELTLEINITATRVLAEVAKGYGIQRFVYASSCSVYGASNELMTEMSQLNPVSLYARAKIASEQALLQLQDDRFSPVILRLATVFGFSPRPRFDLVVNLLTAKAKIDGEITIFGGNQWRPFVHVDDVARAILACLDAPLVHVKGQIFNVGSEKHNYTINQVGDIINGLMPDARIVQKGSDTDARNYRVAFGKIKNTLGFEPQWDLQAGVQQVSEGMDLQGITDYRDKIYSNYLTLSDPSAHLALRNVRSPYAASTTLFDPTAARWILPGNGDDGDSSASSAEANPAAPAPAAG